MSDRPAHPEVGPPAVSAQRFRGQAVFVAGAGGGLGSAISQRLAAEGARLVLADLAPVCAPAGSDALVLRLDARDPGDWVSAREEALSWAPEVCGLAHAVGILGPERLLVETGHAEWSRVIATNRTSAFLALSTFLPVLSRRADGPWFCWRRLPGRKETHARPPTRRRRVASSR